MSYIEWDVNLENLVTLLADRMYSDQALAGIRELISNSIDAKWPNVPVNVAILVDKRSITYQDNGRGIQDFDTTYGVIGSADKTLDPTSIGMFGIGRLSLISRLIGHGRITTRTGGYLQSYIISRRGWSKGTGVGLLVKRMEVHDYGFWLDFPQLDLDIDKDAIRDRLNQIFAIPLLEKQCTINYNGDFIYTPIPFDHKITTIGNAKVYYVEKEDGCIHYCHQGIEVKTEDFTGIEAWVNETELDIKTDREGYVNNAKYQSFLPTIRSGLRQLRPKQTMKKLELDFITKVMSKFRGHLRKRTPTSSEPIIQIPQKLDIGFQFPKEKDTPNFRARLLPKEEHEIETKAGNGSIVNSLTKIHETLPFEIGEEEQESHGEIETIGAQGIVETPDFPETKEQTSNETRNVDIVHDTKPRQRITVKGARAVDLKTDYPMLFFEKEPFTFVFNTTHPILKSLIETEKIDNKTLGVIFERMLECFHLEDQEDIEEIKGRWTRVDESLQDFL